MDTAELHKLIANMEADHRLINEQLRCLKELAEALPDEEAPECEQALEALRRVDHVFRNDVLPHFASEESGLFQTLRKTCPTARPVIAELEQEHAKLREQFESFGGQLTVLRYTDDAGQAPILYSLTRTCWEIWHLLRAHGEKEDQMISEYVLKQLDHSALSGETGSTAK